MRISVLVLLAVLGAGAGCRKSADTEPTIDPNITPAAPVDRAPAGDIIENPTYKLWAKFQPGTSVTQRTTTENENNTEKTVTTITYSLKDKTDEHVVVESQARTIHYTGRVEENPPDEVKTRRQLTLPPGVKKEDWGKPKKGTETGEEIVTAAGKQYKSVWTKSKDFTEAGDLLIQTWTSEDMPGGLLRSISRVPAKKATITVEVIEVKIP